jgi:hypothetical protein
MDDMRRGEIAERNPAHALGLLAAVKGHPVTMTGLQAGLLWPRPKWGVNHITFEIADVGKVPFANGGAKWDPRGGDVLACLLKDETDENYLDWCADLGYEPYEEDDYGDVTTRYNPEHYGTWEVCSQKIPGIVRTIFGEHIDAARELAHLV